MATKDFADWEKKSVYGGPLPSSIEYMIQRAYESMGTDAHALSTWNKIVDLPDGETLPERGILRPHERELVD